jgi:hypothetical protein
MAEHVLSTLGRIDHDFEALDRFALASEIVERLWPQGRLLG